MDTQAHITLFETLTRELGLSEREIRVHLPPMLGDISREIGLPLTLKLIEHMRGRQLFLPCAAKEGLRVTQILGVDAASRIIELLGGDRHIVVPNPFSARFIVRRKAMLALKQGWSINEVVHHFGVSFNTVQSWRKALGMSGRSRCDINHQKHLVMQKLARGDSVREIARSTGVSRTAIYVWKKHAGDAV